MSYKYKINYLNNPFNGGSALAVEADTKKENRLDRQISEDSNYSGSEYEYNYDEDYSSDEGCNDEISDIKNFCKELSEIEAKRKTINQMISATNEKILVAKKSMQAFDSQIVENNIFRKYRMRSNY